MGLSRTASAAAAAAGDLDKLLRRLASAERVTAECPVTDFGQQTNSRTDKQ